MLIAPVFAGGSKEDSLQAIKQRGTLVIATEGNWTPWTYHDASDKLTGFDVELGTLMAKSLGVQPEFHEVPWESILVGVEQGVFDVACNGVGYTAERAEKFSFSDPYLYTEAVLVVRSDNSTVHTLTDLKGKKTSNSPNSTYAQLAESYGATVEYGVTQGETKSRAGSMPQSTPRAPLTAISRSIRMQRSRSSRPLQESLCAIRSAKASRPSPSLRPSTASSSRHARTEHSPLSQ